MPDEIRHNSTLSTLTPAQAIVVTALLGGQDQTAAAGKAGVHRSSINNWFRKDANFRNEFARMRQERAEALHEELQGLERLAIDNIRQILTDPNASPAVRLKTALAVLNRPADPLKAWSVPIPALPIVEIEDDFTPQETIYEVKRPEAERPLGAAPGERETRRIWPTAARPSCASSPNVGRNAPCPCGSGDKFKRCCGKNAPPMLAA